MLIFASVQLYLEHAVFALVNESISRFNLSPGCSLFLGGGIALNCKLNYSLSNHFNRFFNEIWAFPLSGDAGSSIGACFNYLKNVDQKLEHGVQFQNCFLGPEHNNTDLVDRLKQLSFSYLDFESSIPRIISKLQDGEVEQFSQADQNLVLEHWAIDQLLVTLQIHLLFLLSIQKLSQEKILDLWHQ